jgi:hypothetical protein
MSNPIFKFTLKIVLILIASAMITDIYAQDGGDDDSDYDEAEAEPGEEAAMPGDYQESMTEDEIATWKGENIEVTYDFRFDVDALNCQGGSVELLIFKNDETKELIGSYQAEIIKCEKPGYFNSSLIAGLKCKKFKLIEGENILKKNKRGTFRKLAKRKSRLYVNDGWTRKTFSYYTARGKPVKMGIK